VEVRKGDVLQRDAGVGVQRDHRVADTQELPGREFSCVRMVLVPPLIVFRLVFNGAVGALTGVNKWKAKAHTADH
jgi:predicted ester cyclase